ncbi:hypothetical protein IJO12_09480 [bacterium]|nr:hypothetical protein [bacterium]
MQITPIGPSVNQNQNTAFKAELKMNKLTTQIYNKLKPLNAEFTIKKINPAEIRCEIAFNKPLLIEDKTLNPDFLNSLKKVKGSFKEKCTQIKNKMLEKMGFSSNIVDLVVENGYGACSFAYDKGKIGIAPIMEKFLTIEDIIPLIRHELDHFEKAFGIIKKEGVDKYKSALVFMSFNRLGKDYTSFSEDFLNKCLRHKKNMEYFDSKKYLNALEHSTHETTGKDYFENPLEKSAYSVQSRIGRIFSPNYQTDLELYEKNKL